MPKERVKAIGPWADISGISLAAGPLAGEIPVDAFDWHAIFLVNVPIGVALLLAALPTLRESRNLAASAIDVPGTVLSILGVGALAYGLIEGGARGWTSGPVLTSFVAAAVILVAFVAVEQHNPTPMMSLWMFRNSLFTMSNTAMAMVGFSLMGSVFFFSQFFVTVQGASILDSGLETFPISLGMANISPFAGRSAARYGFRIVVTAGMALAGVGLMTLGSVHADTSYGNV
ncbi:hypothetical protein ACFXPV_28170 [Streptomyces sp. NPDC059118]|uniref:hypothetical protein n=1 Tax=unclassified Streptomyces TaxID=2593676 RepID=UPI00369C248A